jgi:hypothetical protein
MIYFLGTVFALAGFALAGGILFCAYADRATALFTAPKLAWWPCVILGGVVGLVAAVQSTDPSFAPRITVTGRAFGCYTEHIGRSYKNLFRFEPASGGQISIQTKIWGPMCRATSKYFDDRTYRIVYLDDTKRSVSNEAISIEVISGKDVGCHDDLDARPLGKWLGVPIGASLAYIGLFGIRARKPTPSPGSAPNESS